MATKKLPMKWSRKGDAILPRKGPITRTMSKRLQEDWARAVEEGPRVLMNLKVDF